MNASAHKMVEDSPATTKGRIPVWLIDDNKYFSHTASSILNESTQVVCTRTFSRCEPAIEALRTEKHPPSVILLDIEMPGLGGLDAIKPLRKVAPTARILMITAFSYDNYIRRALAAGASGYLLKNSSGNEFVRAIQSTVKGGIPVDPNVMMKMIKMVAKETDPAPSPALTQREREILRLVKNGFDNRSIADELGMQYNTVLYHVKNIHDKFEVHSRRELIVKSLKARVL